MRFFYMILFSFLMFPQRKCNKHIITDIYEWLTGFVPVRLKTFTVVPATFRTVRTEEIYTLRELISYNMALLGCARVT